MTAAAFAPLLLTVVGALAAGAVVRVSAPARAARLLCAVAVAAFASTVAALVLAILAAVDGTMAHVAGSHPGEQGIARVLAWCGALYNHQAPRWVGLAAAVLLVVGAVRMASARRRWQREVGRWRHAGPVEVVPGDSTVAFAVPGRPGTVVVGRRLLDLLDRDERRVLLAHERAHLAHGHHRYLQVADLSAAALPFLVPIARQVRYATERWADEVAAGEVGDRHLVARAIIKAALGSTPATPLPAAATGHVTARVDALLGRPTRRPGPAAAWLAPVVITVGAAVVQLHHLGIYLSHATHGHIGW